MKLTEKNLDAVVKLLKINMKDERGVFNHDSDLVKSVEQVAGWLDEAEQVKTFELYGNEEVLEVAEMTQTESDRRNKKLRQEGSNSRWIIQRPLPDNNCSCGAEHKNECVCEVEPDYPH